MSDSSEELPDDAYIPSVDVCAFCGDCYCNGTACVADLDPDADADQPAVEEWQDLVRLGRAWKIMETHGLAVAVQALDHAGHEAQLHGMPGVDRIAVERHRQVASEGWTPEHDDEHDACEMTQAATAYAFYAVGQVNGVCWPEDDDGASTGWPWAASWWKPSDDPIRNLVKAGALIAAEIDRLRRAAATSTDQARP